MLSFVLLLTCKKTDTDLGLLLQHPAQISDEHSAVAHCCVYLSLSESAHVLQLKQKHFKRNLQMQHQRATHFSSRNKET